MSIICFQKKLDKCRFLRYNNIKNLYKLFKNNDRNLLLFFGKNIDLFFELW